MPGRNIVSSLTPPESLFSGFHTPESDVYSFGMLIYNLPKGSEPPCVVTPCLRVREVADLLLSDYVAEVLYPMKKNVDMPTAMPQDIWSMICAYWSPPASQPTAIEVEVGLSND